jgi:carbonic anhydrase/acetyltransferase-like protein (isoleucine patch superfamily)
MILDLLWWLGWVWLAAWTAAPLLLLPVLGPPAGFIAAAVLAPWSALLGMGAAYRVLPRSVCGTFRFPHDRRSMRWVVSSWAPAMYLAVFQPVFFNSRGFQRIVLRVFGARLGAGAWVTSRTVLREPGHVRIGARSLVGEHAHLICSFQPRPGLMVVGDIVIGDDTLVGGYAHVAAGTQIGDRCVIEHAAAVGARVRIGNDARIGAGSAVYNGARIGRGVHIGKHCVIARGAILEDGARVPDGAVVHALRAAPAVQEVS